MFNNKWDELLVQETRKDYYVKLKDFLNKEYNTKTIYPPINEIFKSLNKTDYDAVKVVIIGQDPYHEENQAEGLAFSVKDGVTIPKSLKNIFKELYDDLGIDIPESGSLIKWTEEGVLLLNTILTVEKGKANSHKNKGWEIFTDKIIELLNEKNVPIVFILWGNNAIDKKRLITNPNHKIIESSHPSPLSAYKGFFGSKPFSTANKFLVENNIESVNWKLK